MKHTISLHAASHGLQEELVGGKALNLMLMSNHGLNVPPGFVLTTGAFDCRSDLNLLDEIREDVANLKSPWVMVRSSAIGEDGAGLSFAGQLDSFQVVNDPESIVAGIRRCWDSISNSRLDAYGGHNGRRLQRMGVVIQEMIEPDYAGVMFTASPLNPSTKLIEYVEGHGEKLVSGQVTPESITLPCNGAGHPDFLDPLEEASNEILECFGTHQDIEWAWKDDELFLVQSRPITQLNRRTHWSSTNVNENYPEKLSPLLYSIARRAYYSYFKRLCAAFKLPMTPEDESAFYNIIGLWGDRMYYNMSNIHQVIALTPFKSLMHKSFDNFVGYQGDTSRKAKVGSLVEQGIFVGRLIKHSAYLSTYVKRIETRVAAFAARPTARDLEAGFHDFLDIRFNFWVNASFADFYAMLAHGALGKYLEELEVENAAGLQNTLIQSIPDLVSNEPIFALWQLKELVSAESFGDLFETSAENILHELWQNPQYENLHEGVKQYLADWGFRCSGELTFLTQNYQEDPLSFIRILKIYVMADNQDPNVRFRLKQDEQKARLVEVSRDLNSVQSAVLKSLVRFARFAISCRERVRMQQALAYSHFKAINLSLGADLVRTGLFNAPMDIFYLEYDEVSRILNQEWTDRNYLRSLIALRKKKMAESAECPETFHANNDDYKNRYSDQDAAPNGGDRCYAGLPACGGIIQARAVVLDSIHEIGSLKMGDILVTKQTDPGWICAFPLISGLVVERGGMLSHGAIVAREFGIPAVVGLKDITKIIKTDDIVTVDGNQGLVECHPV